MRNSRNDLGRMVREVWIEWAREQPSPKPSWILSWDELSEPDREVDRRIGERLAEHGWKDADRRIAELEQANRDLERLREEASRERQFVRVGKIAERWYRAKKALERQANTRENDPPESYFERYEMAEARLFAAIEDLKAGPDALKLEGLES